MFNDWVILIDIDVLLYIKYLGSINFFLKFYY